MQKLFARGTGDAGVWRGCPRQFSTPRAHMSSNCTILHPKEPPKPKWCETLQIAKSGAARIQKPKKWCETLQIVKSWAARIQKLKKWYETLQIAKSRAARIQKPKEWCETLQIMMFWVARGHDATACGNP